MNNYRFRYVPPNGNWKLPKLTYATKPPREPVGGYVTPASLSRPRP